MVLPPVELQTNLQVHVISPEIIVKSIKRKFNYMDIKNRIQKIDKIPELLERNDIKLALIHIITVPPHQMPPLRWHEIIRIRPRSSFPGNWTERGNTKPHCVIHQR